MSCKEDVQNYGIIYTPEKLVNKILDLIPNKFFQDPSLRWLDIGAGNGAFSLNLYDRLISDLSMAFPDIEDRRNHIIKKMIYMVEIYPAHIENLKKIFGNKANIITDDFLSLNIFEYEQFDFIIGNPPYNSGGAIKTPTNSKQKKTDDGKAIYVDFIKKSLELLYEGGMLNLIIPSLWLKPDRANLYNILTKQRIHKLHCLSASATQKEFDYHAQTPTCYFLIEKETSYQDELISTDQADMSTQTQRPINIYDKFQEQYVAYRRLTPEYPIPTHGVSIINKLLPFIEKCGYLKVYKTSTPTKKTKISETSSISGEIFQYPNIKTTLLKNNFHLAPEMVINYSDRPLQYSDKTKLVLAHKMYGFPFLDISNTYGISTRDNYIILKKDYKIRELKEIQAFLSTKTAIYIFSTTNYRMRYLEKYAFQFIPNITRIPYFPKLIGLSREMRDTTIYKYFDFTHEEQEHIENYSKNYDFFI